MYIGSRGKRKQNLGETVTSWKQTYHMDFLRESPDLSCSPHIALLLRIIHCKGSTWYYISECGPTNGTVCGLITCMWYHWSTCNISGRHLWQVPTLLYIHVNNTEQNFFNFILPKSSYVDIVVKKNTSVLTVFQRRHIPRLPTTKDENICIL